MALVRGERPGDETPYWRQVVDYCAAGNLQAMLDEYIHTLRDLEGLFADDDNAAWGQAGRGRYRSAVAPDGRPARGMKSGPADDTVRIRAPPLAQPLRHALRRSGTGRRQDGSPRGDRYAKPSTLPFGPSSSRPHPSARRAWTSTPTATRSCTGTCRRTPSTSSSARVAFTATRATPCAKTWRRSTEPQFLVANRRMFGVPCLKKRWSSHRLEGGSCPSGCSRSRTVPTSSATSPALPLSRDANQLRALKQSLAVYRMVFGQPRQDDLMSFLLKRCSHETLQKIAPLLRIDLSPMRRS